ncbi:MAG: DNA polymerase I, partial [Bacteroidales bacterium]|nr:DNA polymerase I [Bacteroidales bacterium]
PNNKTTTPNPQPEGQLQLDLFSAAPIYTSHENLVKYERTFKKIESAADLENLVKILENAKEYAFFAAGDTNDTIKAKIAGMAFSTNQKEAYYINCYEKSDELKSILDLLKPIFTDKAKTIIGHNLKIDLQILENYGINVENQLFDTMLAHYIINPEKKHDIGLLASSELSVQALHCGYVSGESERKTMNINTDSGLALNYSCERAALSLQLKETFSKQISELGKDKLLYEIELPLIKVLMAMERTGVKIDSEAMSDYSKKLQEELREISDKIYDYAGMTFNISSPKQLGTVLFEKMQIAKPKLTKTKSYSTGEEELMKLINKHPIINQILEYRSINKLISTYVDVLPTLVNDETGMLHTSFNQIVTATGRLSSSNPNLQNIPIRDDRGKVIRSAFIASDDEHIFLSADYSQIELRVMAHLSQDEAMLDAFNKYSLDIHTATAAKIFKVSESEVTREMRSKAKTANFGIIYGISAFGLGQRLQISVSEGKSLINSYFETFKGVKQFIDNSIRLAREKEYAETMFGRRRYLPDINSRNSVVRSFAERNAVNAPIQGTAADIVKIAMINIDKRLRENGLKAKMILQVHDELNFNVPKCEMETVKQIVVEEMENCVKLSVPLIVDAKFGKNWLEAH